MLQARLPKRRAACNGRLSVVVRRRARGLFNISEVAVGRNTDYSRIGRERLRSLEQGCKGYR